MSLSTVLRFRREFADQKEIQRYEMLPNVVFSVFVLVEHCFTLEAWAYTTWLQQHSFGMVFSFSIAGSS